MVYILCFLNWVNAPLLALMSDAVAHTLDGCEVQPLGEELNPEREELLVDMDVVRERGLEIINTTAYIAITGTVHKDILFLFCLSLTRKASLTLKTSCPS